MLQQNPILSEIQQIKALEPNVTVKENKPNSHSQSSERGFEQAMAATRQQMDRREQAANQQARNEAQAQSDYKQQEARQAESRQAQLREQNARLAERRQQSTNVGREPEPEQRNIGLRNESFKDSQSNGQSEPSSNASSQSQSKHDVNDDSAHSKDSRQSSSEADNVASSRHKKDTNQDTNTDETTTKPEVQKAGKDSEANSTSEMSIGDKKSIDVVSGAKSLEQTTDGAALVALLDEFSVLLTKMNEGLQASGTDESAVNGELMSEMQAKLMALFDEIVNALTGRQSDGNKPSVDGSSEVNTDAALINQNASSTKATIESLLSKLKNAPLSDVHEDGSKAATLNELVVNLPGNEDIAVHIDENDIKAFLARMENALQQLADVDFDTISDKTAPQLEAISGIINDLFAELKSWQALNDRVSTMPVVEADTENQDDQALSWLNNIMQQTSKLTDAANMANNQNKSVEVIATHSVASETSKSGAAPAVAADSASDVMKDPSSLEYLKRELGLVQSESKPTEVPNILNKSGQINASQLMNSVTKQLQSADMSNANQVAMSADAQTDETSDSMLTELRNLMKQEPEIKTSGLQAVFESGLLNSDKPTSTYRPGVVDVAGVQLDKTLQAPKIENMTNIKNDVVIKENILFNKQELANQIQTQVGLMMARNMKSVDIRLDPPELGSMQIKLSLGEQANVSFVVSSQQAKDALEDSLPKLRELLEQHGMQLGDSDVRKDNSNDEGQSDDGDLEVSGTSIDSDEENLDEATETVAVKSPWQVDYYA